MREAHPNVDLADPRTVVEMAILDVRPKNMERGIVEAILIGKSEEGGSILQLIESLSGGELQ